MDQFTDEEYARDIQEKSVGDILGSLNVARYDMDRITKDKRRKTLSKADWQTFEAVKARIPILEAELARRGERISDWLYPATMFPDTK